MHSEEDKTIQLISRYLLGRLSETEEEEFQQLLKDPSFQQEVNLHREFAEAIERREDTRLKAMLQAEERAVIVEGAPFSGRRALRKLALVGMAIAASLLLALAVYWALNQEPAPSDLYASYFQASKNTLVSVQRSAVDTSLLQNTFQLYENQAYEKSLPGFATLLAADPNDDVAFFQANALMALGRGPEAVPILQRIIRNGDSQYLNPAKWYLALAYLQGEQYDDARPLLEELKDAPFYRERAKALLREKVF